MFSKILKMIKQRRGRKEIYPTAEYWDGKASDYNDTSVSMWPNQILNMHYDVEQKKLLKILMKEVNDKYILDLGCGTGRFSRWFALHGAKVLGVDFSEKSIAIANEESNGKNPAYRCGSVFDIEEKNVYDIVFIWGVLTVACQDGKQLREVLNSVRQALKPGGYLLLTEPVHKGFLHRVLDMPLPEFLKIMGEAGFCVQRTVPLHFWPIRLFLAYISWPGWLTTPLYHVGQALMRLPGLSRLGDYWAIVAFPERDAVSLARSCNECKT